MKKPYLFLLFSLFYSILYAQVWEDQLLKSNPNASFFQKKEAFEDYRKKNPYTKGNGFKPYAREIHFLDERMPKNGKFPAESLYVEWLKEKNKYALSKISSSSNWHALGPKNVPIILSNGKKRGNGRVNAIAFDPIDANVIYIGSPSGGFWKSIDGGSNWETYTDNMPVIGVSSIAINPINPDIIYIATGDANAWDTYSIGVMKSIDGGVNWMTTGLNYNIIDEKKVNKVIINPNHPDSIFAVTNANIMLSIDAGTTWSVSGPLGRWRDIEFKPGDPSVIYAAKQSSGGSNIYRSLNGGSSWSIINNGVSSTGKYRPLIAVTASNPNVIYALYTASDYSFHGIYKSMDSGNSWVLQSNTPNILGRATDGTSTGGQSWYDLSLGVSTIDENHLYVGGINLWESNDGGQNWNIEASSGSSSNYSYMHVDQHCVEFNPINNIAYAGNDGGIYKYMNSLNSWVDISDGLEISQFYKLGLSASNPDRIIAGAQDNGTEMLTSGVWDAIRGADGMECAIDPYDQNLLYSTSQYGGLKKSYDGGNYWDNIKPVSYEGGWVTPYKIHPANNNMIVSGYNEVYLSLTAGAAWDSISYNVSGGQPIKAIALAPSNEDYIYVTTNTRVMVTKNSGNTWTSIKPGLPNINVSDITVSSQDPEKVWVTFSEYSANKKVYESSDGGSNWTNISGTNLPNLPVNCILYEDFSDGNLYIGTDIGVWHKDNSMSEWMPFMNGLPNVIIKELEIQYTSGMIRAATFGRGIWESPLHVPLNINYPNKAHVEIHPNPVSNYLFIKGLNINLKELKIYSVTGSLLLEKELNNTERAVDIHKLSKGCYVVELIDDMNKSVFQKIIKQ